MPLCEHTTSPYPILHNDCLTGLALKAVLVLRGISNHNPGNINTSIDCYNLMMAKWDDIGFSGKKYVVD